MYRLWYLLKWGTTWNNLQWPATSKKQPETTYNGQETTWNDLQQPITGKKWLEMTYNEQETTWNDLQWARNNMEWPTRTWKDFQWTRNDLETTYNGQEMKKKDAKWQATSRFSDYFTIWGKQFSPVIHFPSNIWLQSFEPCFTENHGHSRALNISIVSCVFFLWDITFSFFCLSFVSSTLTD